MLKHSPAPSEELSLMTKLKKETAAASRRSLHGLDLKDLDKLTRNIGKFNPSMPTSQNFQAYLQDIKFQYILEMQPNVSNKDKLYLLRTTSSPEVRSFLDRQLANTKTDYQQLQKALIKEFVILNLRFCSCMSTKNECSAVARFGAESLWQTKDDLRKEHQNPSSS